MIGREARMPLQGRPLHAFRIKNGRLEHKVFNRYAVVQARRGNNYRFADGSLKTKSDGQLDRALNGYVYTFDPNPRHALEIFKARAESDIIRARTMLQTACSDMDEAVTALERLEQDGKTMDA